MDSRRTRSPDASDKSPADMSEAEVVAIMMKARTEEEVLRAVDIQLRHLAAPPESKIVIRAGERLHMLADAHREIRKAKTRQSAYYGEFLQAERKKTEEQQGTFYYPLLNTPLDQREDLIEQWIQEERRRQGNSPKRCPRMKS